MVILGMAYDCFKHLTTLFSFKKPWVGSMGYRSSVRIKNRDLTDLTIKNRTVNPIPLILNTP